MDKKIQKVIDTITGDLKAKASLIGAREAYEDLLSLVSRLNKLGYEIDMPADFDADITEPVRPGFRSHEEARRGIRR